MAAHVAERCDVHGGAEVSWAAPARQRQLAAAGAQGGGERQKRGVLGLEVGSNGEESLHESQTLENRKVNFFRKINRKSDIFKTEFKLYIGPKGL